MATKTIRLAVLMPLASPWARMMATQLQTLGAEVHAIDFASDAPDSYVSQRDDFQAGEVRKLGSTLAGVYLMRTKTTGRFRHILAVPALRRILKQVRPDLLITLYGGGFAVLAWLSGFRPYVVYVMGSDVLLATGLRITLAKRALVNAAVVVSNGRHLAARTLELQPSARVVPLYVGIDTAEFSPGVRSSEPRIISTRGLLPVYNNEYLIE